MNINLYIDKAKLNKRGKAPLKFSVCYGQQYWLPAFESVKPEAFRNGRVTAKEEFSSEINRSLSFRRLTIEQIIRKAEEKGINLASDYLKAEYKKKVVAIDEEVPKSVISNKAVLTFWDCWDDYLETNRKKFSKEHIRKFTQVKGHLTEFDSKLDFPSFNESFYDDYFYGFLIDSKGLTNNTVSKHIKCIKGVLKHGWSLGLITKPVFNDYRDISIRTDRVYLDWDEVERLEEASSAFDIDEQVKDLFLLGCYTGLRWQDLNHLEPHNFKVIDGQYYIRLHSYKGKKNLSNPLTNKALKLCKKYDFNLPKISNQQCNESLKRLARAAKIKSKTERVRYRGNERITEVFEKWQIITMHIARHTFACEFLRRNKAHGLSALKALSEILGHSSTKTTEIYWNMISADKDRMLLNSF